jgi:serine/threonine protein kinase
MGLFLNDRYEVKRKLGKGAFGLVYLVDDTKIDIKLVKHNKSFKKLIKNKKNKTEKLRKKQ